MLIYSITKPAETTMNLNVYADTGQLIKIGEIAILYDRIITIDLKFPCAATKKKQSGSINSYITYNEDTAYPYCITKLSKADIPFRTLRLTHQLEFTGIKEVDEFNLYIRLSYFQRLLIKYHNKKFIWQSPEFKKKFWYSLLGSVISTAIGILIALIFL